MRSDEVLSKDDPAYAGQAVFTGPMLRVYDALVYGFNAPVLWGCSKGELLEIYDERVSSQHLEIGVGTGYMLDNCRFPTAEPAITLMDLNNTALKYTAQRLRRFGPSVHRADVLKPWELTPSSFETVAMANVLHCVPGTLKEKAVAFEHATTALVPGGTLFGTTLLSEGVEQTRRSRAAMKAFNRRGVLCNMEDSLVDLEAGLARTFPSYEVRVQGVIALFVAQAPS